MAWTPVTKPTTRGWTNTNPAGRTQYDQSDITYDDSSMFYDGINPNSWTKVTKPVALGTITEGMTMGLLMPLTYSREQAGRGSWTKVTKPTI